MRVVSLITSNKSIELVIKKSKEFSKKLNVGVTLLYVEPEPLLDIPSFDKDSSFEKTKEKIKDALKNQKLDWAFLAYQADPISHLLLESQREHPLMVIVDNGICVSDILEKIEAPFYIASNQNTQKATILIQKSISLRSLPKIFKQILPDNFDCKMVYEEVFVPDSIMVDALSASVATVEFDLENQKIKQEELKKFCEGLKKEYEFELFSLDFELNTDSNLIVFWIRDRDFSLLSSIKEIKADKDIFIYLERE